METEPDNFFLLQPSFLFVSFSPAILSAVLLALLLLACSALFSAAEAAFISLSLQDIERIRQQEDDPSNQRILKMAEMPRKVLATLVAGNTFVNVGIIVLCDFVLRHSLPGEALLRWAEWLATLPGAGFLNPEGVAGALRFVIVVSVVTFLLVLFGEVTPKRYARLHHLGTMRRLSAPVLWLSRVGGPLAHLLLRWSGWIEKKLARQVQNANFASREDIGKAIELTVSREDAGKDVDILKSIVRFGDVTVRQIMCPRLDIVGADLRSPFTELLKTVRESGFSRLPVYDEDLDNVTGILYVKDLLGHLEEDDHFEWQAMIRPAVLFVPESKKIDDLLREFQTLKNHMAIAVDEYGGTAGLVTLEDIMEEIIGEIKDEFDDEPELDYKKIDDYNYIFEGKSLLTDVFRFLRIEESTFDPVRTSSDTLAGMVLEISGAIPRKDAEFAYGGYRFRIVAASKRRIERIQVTLPQPTER